MGSANSQLARLILDIQALESELHKLERKYRLRSETFYRLCQEGELEQSVDFLKWMGLYETLKAREEEYRHLIRSELTPMLAFLNKEPVGEGNIA